MVALAVLLAGCSGARRGKLVDWDRVPQSEVVLDRALTSEVDGLRVLWNGRVFGVDFNQRGFIAGSRSQFVALWKRVEAPAREPTVDFSKYVVLAVVGGGGKCPIEVLAVELHPPNVLRPRTLQASYSCQDVMVRRALVLAVPRRLLGPSVIFVERGVFKFSVPKPGEAAETRKAQIARALSVPAGDSVEIPDRGKISLRTLPGGSQIWVAHQRDGSLNVLASTFRPEDPFHEDLAPYTWWSSAYSKERGRFFEGHDARGRSVHGLSPLQAYSWTRVDESHIRLGVAIPTEPGPIQAPDAAPVLEGPDYAYKDLPVEQWESVADGQVARVDIDLVAGNRRPAELCSAPDRSSPVDYFTECPAGSPTVEGSSSSLPHHIEGYVVYGPIVLQRNGEAASVLNSTLHERRRLPRVPAVTCPLQARRGQYRGYQVEWTHKDGPEARHRLCPGSSGAILFDSAILHGDGSEQLGDELRRGLEPRLAKILPVGWTRGCDGSLAIILPSKEHDCRIDEVIEMIGEYLRKRDANDRIVVMRGLHAAPAL